MQSSPPGYNKYTISEVNSTGVTERSKDDNIDIVLISTLRKGFNLKNSLLNFGIFLVETFYTLLYFFVIYLERKGNY